ncbi:MAG TPA: hypothetical protein VMW06_10830 [Desulfobacterales bacterium]|nr:hypothetical protein [Desulfobacterales bacterium]
MAGSVVTQEREEREGIVEITLDWTADDTDGGVPETIINWPIAGILSYVTTNPGAPAPQDLYDITLKDEDGVDVMGGALDDRKTATSEVAFPKEPGATVNLNGVAVSGILTFGLTGNNVNSAVGRVRLTILRLV